MNHGHFVAGSLFADLFLIAWTAGFVIVASGTTTARREPTALSSGRTHFDDGADTVPSVSARHHSELDGRTVSIV